jgi:proline racemase
MLDLGASFQVIDSHTAGHPTRVVLSGIPALPGKSVRERRDHFRERYDHLRPLLLHEPRGHAAMVGLIPVPSDVADYGAFFISSYIYLDMCGHGTIGYAKTLAASGQLSAESGIERFTLETPAGIVTVGLNWDNSGNLAGVRLQNVPSYVAVEGLKIAIDGIGAVALDIAYGGMWYALVNARDVRLDLKPEFVSQALRLGTDVKALVNAALQQRPAGAPQKVDSVIFYDEVGPQSAIHLVVLESNKFDRSPCGTGTAARLAQLHNKRRLSPGETYQALNILGVSFEGRIVDEASKGDNGAIVPEIEGNAHITAFSTIVRERADPLASGFLCR